jgi:8-oxo-dGTP pyrophosphatase MutT (NUDIX family)
MISIDPIENFNKKFDVVSLFVVHDGKILLLKRQKGKPQEKTWGPPAGKVDDGESLKAAVLREVFEETGIIIEEGRISNYEKSYYVRHGDLDFMFYAYMVEVAVEPSVVLRPAEHSESSWFTLDEALGLDLVQDEEVPIRDFFGCRS